MTYTSKLYRVEKIDNTIIFETEELFDAIDIHKKLYPSKIVRDADNVLLSYHLPIQQKIKKYETASANQA